MSIKISPNLPANVVEIGQELAQATLDGINNAESPSSGNPMITQSALTTQIGGFIGEAPTDGQQYARQNSGWSVVSSGISDAPSDGQLYGRINGGWSSVPSGTKPFIKASDYVTYGAYTVQASDFGGILLYDVSGGLIFDANNSYPDDKELIIFVGAGSGGSVSPAVWNFTGSYGTSMFLAYCWIRAIQHQGYLYIA